MKSNSLIINLVLVTLLACGVNVVAQQPAGKGTGRSEAKGQATGRREAKASQEEQTVATAAVTESVNITLTTGAGKISVRGWDRAELRAQTSEAGTTIELRKAGGPDASTPSTRVEILISDKSEEAEPDESCDADADVILDVPRGATLYLKTQDGDVDVEDIGEAHIETTGGRIDLRRVAKATDAKSVGGDVTLENSRGRARLASISGVIGIRELGSMEAGDFLKVTTATGDILLDRVGTPRVEAGSITGVVKMIGSLARGGTYGFTTTIGDITLVLGAESSFKLNAKVSEGGEIITEFPLKYKGPASPVGLLQSGRLVGTYGSGDATINMVSFSGTLRLRKK
jgi:DUF4097 and DUF4098 domain-containing protein YvlB